MPLWLTILLIILAIPTLALFGGLAGLVLGVIVEEVGEARKERERERLEAMTFDTTPYHVFVIVDHDAHEVRVVDDGRIARFYLHPGWEPDSVIIDPLGPIVEFRKMVEQEAA